jgi:hypothetical protein
MAADEAWKGSFEAGQIQTASDLDASDTNRSNRKFSDLSMEVARNLLTASPKLEDLEKLFEDLATQFNKGTKPPFCCVEGVKYAIDALKFSMIEEDGHVVICVPFYMEFERGTPATEENPNGEESPIQKLTEALFLLEYGTKMSIDIIFINDSIAEKKDEKDGGSANLFKTAISKYCVDNNITTTPGSGGGDMTFLTAMDGRLCIKFTSVGEEAAKGSPCESAEEKTKRLENRGPDGKLRERKGGAVLSGLEVPIAAKMADKPQRVIRCLVDGDSAHPVGSFIGDAAYAVLQLGDTAYLGNLKDPLTCISIVGADSGGGDDATQARFRIESCFSQDLLFHSFSLS